MDQTFLAGIGNLYSDEVLFAAKVLPTRTGASLKDKEIKDIYQKIKRILLMAIKYKGTSTDTYLDIYGRQGQYISFLKVYGRQEKPCFKCGQKIKSMKLGGRTAHFCSKCQK